MSFSATAHADLRPINRISSEFFDTTKFQHFFHGIEVIGSQALRHVSPKGTQEENHVASFDLNPVPTLSAEDAIRIARVDLTQEAHAELKILPRADRTSADLVYFVHISQTPHSVGREVWVDAHSGHILANLLDSDSLAPITVYSAKGRGEHVSLKGITSLSQLDPKLANECQLWDDSGNPFWINSNGCTPVIVNSQKQHAADADELRTALQTKKVLQYYWNVHHRNSYDNNGSPLVSIVHAGDRFDNAFWNIGTNQMAYGDGDGILFRSFTYALDVIGHEITHGITAATAKLLRAGESGALNEAYSDFFGKMIANDGDWTVGRKIFINQTHAPGIRDLADPGRLTFNLENGVAGKYPASLSEEFTADDGTTCDSSNDNCYVHTNSTIASHAAYLVVKAVGKPITEHLYYMTLTHMLTAAATFKSAAQSTVQACMMMYTEETCRKVSDALNEAGLETHVPELRD